MAIWQIVLAALVVATLIVALIRGARSSRALREPVHVLAMKPDVEAAASVPAEAGAKYELWLRMRLRGGRQGWALTVTLRAAMGDAPAVDTVLRLRDDNEGGVAGLPHEGVVNLDHSSESTPEHTRLSTTCLLERIASPNAGSWSIRVHAAPGEGTTVHDLALLVLHP